MHASLTQIGISILHGLVSIIGAPAEKNLQKWEERNPGVGTLVKFT